jgi:polyphenol oxidase
VSGPPAPLSSLSADLPEGVTGFFTTRFGGTSEGVWAEANLALHVADDVDRVLANRALLGRWLGAGWVNFPQQVHGAGVLVVDSAAAGGRRITRGGARGVDALVTALPGTPVGVLVADCLPVLMADGRHGVVAAAHAGRRGLAAGVLQATVTAMLTAGAQPADCVAVIGPSVCGRCYEVPADMRDDVERRVPGSAATSRRGTPSLDLAAGAERILRTAGFGDVRQTAVCTVEDERFYSYRRDGRTGRCAGVVMVETSG